MNARPRFTLERELGHGGEGRVVAVRDAARAGALVALKETHGPHGRALAAEFELLATLRHRHLAEVYEYFPTSPLGGDKAAYTQVLVPGADLYMTLKAEPALADALVAQLLTALAQLHAAGLAHLDLKPDNVIVEPGAPPRARLVDFGIAARLGSRPDIVRGSKSYVAPEILAGEPVAPGADLFALGVALAEVALGSAVAARSLAAEVPVVRRQRLEAAGLSSATAALTAELIELDPLRRPKTASEAARLWGSWCNTSLELVTAASATGLVRSGGLVARAAEKARVLDAIEARRVVTIGGPAASGRTALMESALREAQLRGHTVEAWPLVERTASVDGFREALGRLVPDAERLALTPANEDLSSPERWTASLDAAADAALSAFAALTPGDRYAALFVRQPAAAPAAVRAFLRAARKASTAGVSLPLALVLGAEADDADVLLGAVGAEEVRGFVESRFGAEVAGNRALVSTLASASGGLTGHLEALCELLVARGALVLGEDHWILRGDPSALALPPDLGDAVAGRVALLDARERAVLIAIGLGRGLSTAVVAAAVGEDAPALAATIDDLVAHGLVRRDADGTVALGHQALAEVLPALTLDDAGKARVLACPDLPDIVRARLEGGAGGSRRALEVAREALRESRPEGAERACELALSLADRTAERLDALSLRAEIADRLGPREAQLAALRSLIAGLAASVPEDDPRRLAAEARLFWTLTRMGDPSFESGGEALVVRARAAGQPLLAAEVAVHLAIVASQRGEQDRAETLLLSARAGLGERRDTLALRARISNNIGNVHAYRGEFARAQDAYREARRLKLEEGDPVGERIALGNMALMSLELGEPARALDDLAQSFELARRIGHRRGEAWSLLTLAEVGLEGASPRYARRRAGAAASLAAALGDQLVEGDARTTLAEALLVLGEPIAACVEAARGMTLALAAENRWTAARARTLERIATFQLAASPERDAIASEVAAIAGDDDADATTRQIAARHAAEVALGRGDTAAAYALVTRAAGTAAEAAPGARSARGGIRRAELLHTRIRIAAALGNVDGDELARARADLERWVTAWPEAPSRDGVDDAALSEGPCRRTVLAHPTVMALLGAELSRDTAPRSPPTAEQARPLHQEPLLADETLASLSVAELDRRLTRALVDIVRKLDAERAFLVRIADQSAAAAPSGSFVVLEARDADGEPIGDARKRIPEAALEAVQRGAAWRAPGPDNKGAIAVVPWTVTVGGREVNGAVVLQNRFITDAFADGPRSLSAIAELRLLLRLRLLESALDEARRVVEAAAAETKAVEARTTEEIRNLRRELESTREQLGPAREYPEIIFASGAMKKMLRQVDRVIATDLPVHVHGESGTGKELVARAIHHLGARARGPFVPQNCTAIPPTLFESELFGHERGAFTGAMRSNEGLFRRSHGGTLFLDEIGDLPLELQAKLLRVLETSEVRPVGATRSITVDVRIISATHRDLTELIKKGSFREDLYYRLNVIRIDVPPLRDRPEDIPALLQHFLARRGFNSETKVEEAAMRALVRFSWPGNVRQLENEIARASLLADKGVVTLADLSPEVAQSRGRGAHASPASESPTLGSLGLAQGPLKDRVDRLEALVLEEALRDADGNKSEVARVLGLSRAGLNLKLKRLGLWDSSD